jgi:hypothetical protein
VWKSKPRQLPHVEQRRPHRAVGESRHGWRGSDAGMRPCYLQADAPRVACPQRGIVVASIPWARHGSWFTTAFDEHVAWACGQMPWPKAAVRLSTNWCSRQSVVERVVADLRSDQEWEFFNDLGRAQTMTQADNHETAGESTRGHGGGMVSYNASNRSTNHRLIYWQQRVGLNNTRLAAAIRERAGKCGHRHVQPDARRVRAWRQGERPRDPVPELILEVFSERIGAPLALSDIGLDIPGAERVRWDGPWPLIQTVAEIITSARGDLMLGRRGGTVPPQEFLRGQDLLCIVQSWTTTAAESPGTAIRSGRKQIGDQEVAQIRAVTEAFRSLDNAYGGGLTREAVIGQLISRASLVEDTTCSEEVGRKLITGIGDLAAVAGWMCHDVSMHSAAQRYFLLAFQAAKEADDPNLAAHVLSCMARQAGHLDRPKDALELIHLARYGARHTATPRIGALCTAWRLGITP